MKFSATQTYLPSPEIDGTTEKRPIHSESLYTTTEYCHGSVATIILLATSTALLSQAAILATSIKWLQLNYK